MLQDDVTNYVWVHLFPQRGGGNAFRLHSDFNGKARAEEHASTSSVHKTLKELFLKVILLT